MTKYLKCVKNGMYPAFFTIGKVYEYNGTTIDSNTGKISGARLLRGLHNRGCEFEEVENPNNANITDEEIFNMLLPKLERYGVKPKETPNAAGTYEPIAQYQEKDVIKAVATAYRSGYFRSQKGRPFKFKEKNESKPKSDKFVVNKNGDKIYYCNNKVEIGDKVVFICKNCEKDDVWPSSGTVGRVVDNAFPYPEGLWIIWEELGDNKRLNWRSNCKKVVE